MKSPDRGGLNAHHGSGDVKAGPDTPGCNTLPDGTTALTAAFIEDAYRVSQQAKQEGK
jgi:hypothetical protein